MTSDLAHVSMTMSPSHENQQVIRLIHINVIGTDYQTTEKILTGILNELEILHVSYKTILGEHEIDIQKMPVSEKVDTALLDWQQKVRSNVGTLNKELEDSLKSQDSLKEPLVSTLVEHPINSSVKYAVIGFFAGGFIAAFFVCLQYVLMDRVASDKEIKSRFGLVRRCLLF